MTIGVDGDRAVLVGPEYLRRKFPISLEYLARWVPESVAATDADDGDARTERLEEFARTRCQAPVVRHFEDAQPGARDAPEDRALSLPADVAGQDDRHVVPQKFEHQRVVVAHVLALPVWWPRMPYDHLHTVDRHEIAGLQVGPARSDLARDLLE